MKNNHYLLANSKFLFATVTVLLVLLVVSLPDRKIQSDESWFGEQAYWFSVEGEAKLKSIPDIFNWDEYMPVHHKLLTWTGAVIIKVFGWSLLPLRLYMLLLSAITFFVMFKWCQANWTDAKVKTHFMWVTVLLLTTPEFIDRVFFFRPEVLVMCFAMLSFYFLNAFHNEKKQVAAVLAGLFAGLAFVSHLTGVVFPVAGFLLLLYYRHWKGLVVYSIIGVVVCLVYTEGLWSEAALQQYLFELRNWPSHSFDEKVGGGIFAVIWSNIMGVLDEHKRYFWDQNVWIISGLFFLILLFFYKSVMKKAPILLGYTLTVMILMGLVNGSSGPRYLMYVFPFMALIIAFGIERVTEKKKTWRFALAAILVTQMVFLGSLYAKIFSEKVDHVAENEKVLSQIELGATIIGPWELIYNNIDDYTITNFKTFEYQDERREEPFSQMEVLERLDERRVQYIILNEWMKKSPEQPWFNDWQIVDNEYYTEYRKEGDFFILKRNAD